MSLYVRARIVSSDFDVSAFETLFEIPLGGKPVPVDACS
jgi:hypothetical protein